MAGCLSVPQYVTNHLDLMWPQVMLGYLQPDGSLLGGVDSDGWLHTGDIGRYDSDGYFMIVDRLKELIKVKGKLLSLSLRMY